MMKSIMLAVALASGAVAAQTNAVLSTIRADGTTNLWTEADLKDALGLMNRKYWRDMATANGRAEWHGKVVKSESQTNETGLVRVDTYEDGYVHTEKAKRVQSRPNRANPMASSANRAAKLRERIATNDVQLAAIPVESITTDADAARRYAALMTEGNRLRRMLERELARQTNTVSVVIIPERKGN